jgi:Xaa-Pro dipeptidase
MTKGVGGSTAVIELAKLTSQRDQAVAIGLDEYQQRIDKVCAVMLATGIDALYLDATTSLRLPPSSIIQTNTGRPIL